MNERVTITFDRETLRKFKKSYKYAVMLDTANFTFQGHDFNTAFAKYLIEYLEPVMDVLERHPFQYPAKRVD